jgi:uncharacterized protein YbbK (DUF523 family)
MLHNATSYKILFSACLLGSPVRYNGTDLQQHHIIIEQWQQQGCLVSLCPEVAGGLNTPRPAAEIQAGDGTHVLAGDSRILTDSGQDVTAAFISGAHKTLAFAQQHNVIMAVLTERSPSCGSQQVYSGRFDRSKIDGRGVTAELLHQHQIKIFNQHQLVEANQWFQQHHEQTP